MSAIAVLLLAVIPDSSVKTLDGHVFPGNTISLSEQRYVIRTEDLSGTQERSFNADQIAEVTIFEPPRSAQAPANPAAWIELVDGSRILATEFSLARRNLACKTPLDSALAIVQRDVKSVRLAATNDAVDARWREIVSAATTEDQLVVRRGERAIDALGGIVRGITTADVQFEIDGEVQAVKRDKVFGVVFFQPPARKLSKAACTVFDRGGNALMATKLNSDEVGLGKNPTMTIVTLAGLSLKRKLTEIEKIDFAGTKTVFLGDVKPESVAFTPLVGEATEETAKLYQPRADRALFGGPLLLPRRDGRTYAPAWEYQKGLSLHSRTKIVFRLPRDFKTFTAIAGIDSRLRPTGSVRLQINGDDKELFAAAITGKDAPKTLSLDTRGVKRLTIFVDYGDDSDAGDHLNLCEARLVE